MEIRRAGANEALTVADLWLRSRAASVPAIPPPVHTDEEVRAWFSAIVLATKEVWVAELEGEVAALLVLEENWVDQLYVDPSHTGHGLGTALINLAKARRPQGLQLWTFQANEGARRFYERHGFIAADATDGDNEEGAPDVRYEWRPHAGTPDPPQS